MTNQGENTYHSSQKANLSNNKGLQDIDKKKAHNPTEKWAKDTYIGSFKKKEIQITVKYIKKMPNFTF